MGFSKPRTQDSFAFGEFETALFAIRNSRNSDKKNYKIGTLETQEIFEFVVFENLHFFVIRNARKPNERMYKINE